MDNVAYALTSKTDDLGFKCLELIRTIESHKEHDVTDLIDVDGIVIEDISIEEHKTEAIIVPLDLPLYTSKEYPYEMSSLLNYINLRAKELELHVSGFGMNGSYSRCTR